MSQQDFSIFVPFDYFTGRKPRITHSINMYELVAIVNESLKYEFIEAGEMPYCTYSLCLVDQKSELMLAFFRVLLMLFV